MTMNFLDKVVAAFKVEVSKSNKGNKALLERIVQAIENDKNVIRFQFDEERLRGPQGKKPVKGIDYFTTSEVKDFLRIASPRKGKDYFTQKEIDEIVAAATPKNGRDYYTRDERDALVLRVVSEVKKAKDSFVPKKGKDYFTTKDIGAFMKTIITSVMPILKREIGKLSDRLVNVEKAVGNITADLILDLLDAIKPNTKLMSKARRVINKFVNIRRGAAVSSGGGGGTISSRLVEIAVSDPLGDSLTAGNGKAYHRVTADEAGLSLTAVGAHASTPSNSGAISIMLRRNRAGVDADMLSTAITIDVNEKDSKDATPAVIDTANDDLLEGDEIWVDLDGAGTAVKGINVTFKES